MRSSAASRCVASSASSGGRRPRPRRHRARFPRKRAHRHERDAGSGPRNSRGPTWGSHALARVDEGDDASSGRGGWLMSTLQDPFLPSPYTPEVTRRVPLRNTRFVGPIAVLLLALLAMSLVRVVTGAQDITSAGTLAATLTLAMPIALCGLGGLWSERSGVVNIGLEGMMILGTWFGADFAHVTGNAWLGVVGGLFGGLIGGAIHAVATVTFGVDQIVSGVAINILALGMGRYLSGG